MDAAIPRLKYEVADCRVCADVDMAETTTITADQCTWIFPLLCCMRANDYGDLEAGTGTVS